VASRLERHATHLRVLAVVVGALAIAALVSVGGRSRGARAVVLRPDRAPRSGSEVANGFVLSLPHRGEAHDILMTARRTRDGVTHVVELHLLDRGRWPDIRETAHYGVAWEVPRTTASWDEAEAVTEALAQIVRRNDAGAGVSVDALSLSPDAPVPPAVRVLQRVSGWRALGVGLLLVLVTWALATLPRGAALVSLFLFALGLALRLPHLDVPFVRDQDVQRVFTGHASWGDIFMGIGLRDRHPPLYFAILHVAQWFGQAERVVRMPAVISAALMGPAFALAAVVLGRRVALAAIVALVPTVAFAFVSYSREVSSLPFHALTLVLLTTAVAKDLSAGTRLRSAAVVACVAIALFTFYTAVFPVLAVLLLLMGGGADRARARRDVAFGLLAGSPALLLAVGTFFRDQGARAAASTQPNVAWGNASTLELARGMRDLLVEAVGPVALVAVVVAGLLAMKRRDTVVLLPLAVFVATFLGIAGLTSVARVQPYYLLAAVPALLLAVALTVPPVLRGAGEGTSLLLAVGVALSVVPTVAAVGTLYLPDERASMPVFVDVITRRSERRVVTIAHYDMPLVAYYVARARGVEVDFSSLEQGRAMTPIRGTDVVLFPIVQTHTSNDTLEADAVAALEAVIADGPCLVIDRPTLRLDGLQARLTRCERLAEGADSALYRCAPEDTAAR
jgi:hypothetical protein